MRSKFATKRSGFCLDAAEKTNAPHQTNNQPVILSASRTFSERIARKKQGAKAPQGSRNEFWWLSFTNVTFRWQATEISNEIPHRLKASRFCIGSSPRAAHSLNKTSTSVGGRTRRPALRMTNRGFVSRYALEKTCDS